MKNNSNVNNTHNKTHHLFKAKILAKVSIDFFMRVRVYFPNCKPESLEFLFNMFCA
jgi:hypothetical protein